jgi:hypothetical protein
MRSQSQKEAESGGGVADMAVFRVGCSKVEQLLNYLKYGDMAGESQILAQRGVQSKVEETPFQTKRRRHPFPLPQAFGGEDAPSGAGEGAARRVVKGFKKYVRRFRAVWNGSLTRPFRATLSPQGGEGTASDSASFVSSTLDCTPQRGRD